MMIEAIVVAVIVLAAAAWLVRRWYRTLRKAAGRDQSDRDAPVVTRSRPHQLTVGGKRAR